MSERSTREPEDVPLNPALKSRTDTTYDTDRSTPPPLSTTGAREGQGESWPVIWLVVTVICVILAIWFLL